MSYSTWQIVHVPYDKTTGTWNEALQSTIPSFYDPVVKMSLGSGKDSFEFKITDFADSYTNFFNPLDKIYIYRAHNTDTVTSSDLLMVGAIRDVPKQETGSDDTLRVEGYNYSETIMNAICFVDLTNSIIPTGLKAAVDQVGSFNENFKVEWDNTNPTLTSTGAAFPLVGKKYFNVRLLDILEKNSVPQKTTDGFYFWYVDKDNKLQWRHQDSYSSDGFDYTTTPCKSIKISKDVKDIKNYLVMKGGIDPAGKQIQRKVYDPVSVAKHGQKFYVITSESNNAQELNKQDLDLSYGNSYVNTKYPTFPFTTVWKSTIDVTLSGDFGTVTMISGSSVTINQGSQASNEKAYVAAVRSEVLNRLYIEGNQFIDAYAYGKYKIDLEFLPGTTAWGLGTRISANIPEMDVSAKTMRVYEILYGEDNDIYSLEEDVGTI
jgi:hypothetical protein